MSARVLAFPFDPAWGAAEAAARYLADLFGDVDHDGDELPRTGGQWRGLRTGTALADWHEVRLWFINDPTPRLFAAAACPHGDRLEALIRTPQDLTDARARASRCTSEHLDGADDDLDGLYGPTGLAGLDTGTPTAAQQREAVELAGDLLRGAGPGHSLSAVGDPRAHHHHLVRSAAAGPTAPAAANHAAAVIPITWRIPMERKTSPLDFKRVVAQLPESAFEVRDGLLVAHTDPAAGLGEWWHVARPGGVYVGSANTADLVPLLIAEAA